MAEPRLEEHVAVMADGVRLPVRIWMAEAPKAVIVGVHGHNSYSHTFENFGPAQWFAERNITLYAYDQRGFGEAPGRGTWAGGDLMAQDLISITKLVSAAHPGLPVYILGESMGGDVTLRAMSLPDAPKVSGLILASPAVRGWDTMDFSTRWKLRLAAFFIPNTVLTRNDLGWRTTENQALRQEIDADPLFIKGTRIGTLPGIADLATDAEAAAATIRVPTLYLYGGHDEAIPASAASAVIRTMRRNNVPLTLACYPDGWHAILQGLNREIVWRDIVAWMGNSILPSGATRSPTACGLDVDY